MIKGEMKETIRNSSDHPDLDQQGADELPMQEANRMGDKFSSTNYGIEW